MVNEYTQKQLEETLARNKDNIFARKKDIIMKKITQKKTKRSFERWTSASSLR